MQNNDPIPLINVAKQNQALRQEILAAITGVVDSGAFVLGAETKKFEDDFKAYTNVPYAVSCASGSDALLLPLMAINIQPGDEVIVPSFTFYATAGAVARLGAKLVFADSDETYNISLDDVARKITPKTRAVIPVHLFGQMADMPGLNKITQNAKQKITVIEDAAQSMGAAIDGKQAGLWGDFTAYSFYPTKNLGAMGDAGMMAALTAENAELLKMIRVHGSKERYFHELVGANSRLDSMQAALLRVKLRHLRDYEDSRNRHAALYTKLFESAKLEEFIRLPVVRAGHHRHVWNQFTIRAKNRDKLRAALQEQKIGSEIYYPLPMHEQKAFAPAGFKHGDLPVCEAMAKEVLSLPMFPELTEAQVLRVVEAVSGFYR